MSEEKLTPTRITLESSVKFFGLDSGRSDGSSCTIEFAVPEGAPREWIREQLWIEKEKLDNIVVVMELAKGSTSRTEYEVWKERHKQAYDQLLKRGKSE